KADSGPRFARALEAQPARKAEKKRFLTPGVTVLALLTATSVALLVLARPDGAQNLSSASANVKAGATRSGRAASTRPAGVILVAQNDSVPAPASPAENSASGRRSVDFYTQGVRGSMFSAPQPPAPKPPKVVAPPVEKPKPAPIVPVVEIN